MSFIAKFDIKYKLDYDGALENEIYKSWDFYLIKETKDSDWKIVEIGYGP